MVKMAPKLAFVGREGIDVKRMREERAARVREVMKKRNIPALLVTNAPNVRFLTELDWWEFQPRLNYCLFFAEHDTVLFAHAGAYQQMPDLMPWIKHWRIARAWMDGIAGEAATKQDAALWAKEIREELETRKMAGEPLGVVGYDSFAEQALREQHINVAAGGPVLLEAAKIKTKDEINCLRVVAAICTAGWQKALEVVRPGVLASDAARQIQQALYEAGAETPFASVVSGPMAFERNLSWVNRRIEWGDLVYIPECGTSFLGYTCCLYRSFVVGRKPSSREADWYKEMRDRMERVIDEIRPGKTTADAARHFPPASKWGYKDEAEVLTIEWGHGVGMVQIAPGTVHYNWPAINRLWSLDHPQEFEPGMVIAVESCEGEHQVSGVRLEDMVIVTDRGAEYVDSFPRDEITVIGG
jgi:Xaa-Pro aminopeptidase